MLMTPLMVVMFSLGGTVTGAILFERLLDTLIGCLIALVLGYYVWPNKDRGNTGTGGVFRHYRDV